ncbi:hypothetical protein F5Y19DRAFT_438752 [Xylariaceae sp. FL1651]|nr:hypothetical protein F5Y19DRAFT_438752 [Xylariaceae sp. FL1651]
MVDEDPADVFSFPDFSQSAKWVTLSSKPQDQFFSVDLDPGSNSTNSSFANTEPSYTAIEGFFKIPTALTVPNLNGHEHKDEGLEPIAEPLHDTNLPDLDYLDDLWHGGEDSPVASAEYKTWDAFQTPGVPQTAPLFITEAGPLAYDAAITDENDPLSIGNTDHLVIQTNPYLTALLALTLGRGSAFFVWDARKSCFITELEEMRIIGYSTKVLRGLQDRCMRCGTTTRFLSSYVQLTYKTRLSAVQVALAKAVDIILLAIQRQLGERGRRVRSLLQLQSLVQPIETILVYIHKLIRNLSRMRTDEQILSQVFHETQVLENDDSLLRALMCEVLSRASEPWTNFAEKWIGVKSEEGFPMTKDGLGKSFVKVETIAGVDDSGFETEERDYVLDESRMPAFVPPDIALAMFEAGRNLRLLRTHHPDHPLCHPGTIASSKPPDLRWSFDWSSIEKLQGEVASYEKAVLQKIFGRPPGNIVGPEVNATLNRKDDDDLQVFGNDGTHLERQLLASIRALDQPPSVAIASDRLSALLEMRLFHEENQVQQVTSDSGPHWSLIPLHSFGPLVTAQARLINSEYMKLLFSAHGLREQLRIQREYHLLGNGMFCSRLSHALFDPDLETAERQAGVALNGGIMGLRMNGRENWPPASSELRLALMGILNETYFPPSSQDPTGNNDLPGDLSFSLRDLPPEEIDKCMDPSSLEALDFLRLSYKAPAPLSPIFTPVILVKYDKVFKLLLRLLRMLYVVGQLFRDTSRAEHRGQDIGNVWFRFRFEAQHFVQSISTYFFDTGIQMPWQRFENWLDTIQSSLARVDTGARGTQVSPDKVLREHEKMLDSIMYVLLLRKRQQPVLELLEEIFKVILKFSRQVQLEVEGKVDGNASKDLIQGLYKNFRKRVEIFVTVCHGLSERGGGTGKAMRHDATIDDMRQSDGINDENTVDRLLINLDMLDYYSRPKF